MLPKGTVGRYVLIAMSFLLTPGLLGQQSTQPSRAALKAEIGKLTAELASCRGAASDSRRQDALASLKAVKSALDTGANLQEFKKYQIESRIKVDALPETPDNQNIRAVSDLYRDAVTFSVVKLTGGKISASEVSAAKTRYSASANAEMRETITKYLDKLVPEDMLQDRAQSMTKEHVGGHSVSQNVYDQYVSTYREYLEKMNGTAAGTISQLLLVYADEALAKVPR